MHCSQRLPLSSSPWFLHRQETLPTNLGERSHEMMSAVLLNLWPQRWPLSECVRTRPRRAKSSDLSRSARRDSRSRCSSVTPHGFSPSTVRLATSWRSVLMRVRFRPIRYQTPKGARGWLTSGVGSCSIAPSVSFLDISPTA